MDRDELLAFLRENLKITVDLSQHTAFGPSEELSVEVALFLGDQHIDSCKASVSLPTPD